MAVLGCLLVLVVVTVSSTSSFSARTTNVTASPPESCKGVLSDEVVQNIRSFHADVDKIIDFVLKEEKGETWKQLADFVDRHGPRFAGTSHLERAIDDRIDHLSNIVGKPNVYTEPFDVPRWVRGETRVVLLDAWSGGRNKTLSVLTLGYSVGTNGTLIADAIVVRSFEELDALPNSEVGGKIVVFYPPWEGYAVTVQYRSLGASAAAAKGGLAALIRSATGYSLYTPHTGMMSYTDMSKTVPAISITEEDAALMWRKYKRGESIRLSIESTARMEGTAVTRNTIAEMRGFTRPDEIVLIGGHIDSWDVGQGAMDDGGGAAISWRILDVLKKMNLPIRRTIRTVLFSGEEMGVIGGQDYFNAHQRDASRFQFVLESDMGLFSPTGLMTAVKNNQARCMVVEIVGLLARINATTVVHGDDGPDISQWFDIGVPGGAPLVEDESYFNYHHTEADSMIVMKEEDLDIATAIWTSVAYVMSQIDSRIPHDNV